MKSGNPKNQSIPRHSFPQRDEFQSRLIEGASARLEILDLEGRLLGTDHGVNSVPEKGTTDEARVLYWIDGWKNEDREKAQEAIIMASRGTVGRFVGSLSGPEDEAPTWWDVMISPMPDASGQPERLLAISRDITEWKRADSILHAILEGTSTTVGQDFFHALARNLAQGLGVRYSYVAECLSGHRARSLSFWQGSEAGPDFEYDLRGTPCFEVAEGRTCHYHRDLQALFPEDKPLVEMEAESYLGVPLRDSSHRVIGHLVIMDDKPMPNDLLTLSVMEAFAIKAGLELERLRAFDNLTRQHQESEERFRDLFDEAPIAYVHEGVDTRFIRANRAALRILGITAEEVEGTYGKTFIAESPEAQRRAQEALESIGKGTDTSGVVLELRRKDNGKPVWIQWWSKPDSSGEFTRTMFVDITERVLMEREKARLEAQNVYLQEEIRGEHDFGEIVGGSPALLEVLRMVEQVALIDSTVLVLGETGTGKELIARAIHDRSPRRDGALIKVNCGAISAGLVESELFGHVKGAFTGAIAHRDGRFKLADRGTIFLDEVGELPLDTQVKLLRVLQEQEFEPIGSSQTIRVDVRVVAATNRDLKELVEEGKFRADLFYRLNVVPLRIPPLRERVEDLPLLIPFFAQKCAAKLGKRISSVSQESMRRMTAYNWPGNIRELQNVIERAVILCAGDSLELTEKLRSRGPFAPSARNANSAAPMADLDTTISPTIGTDTRTISRDEVERRHLESVLRQTNWMIEGERGAAKILEMKPSTLRSRMQKLGIKRPDRSTT